MWQCIVSEESTVTGQNFQSRHHVNIPDDMGVTTVSVSITVKAGGTSPACLLSTFRNVEPMPIVLFMSMSASMRMVLRLLQHTSHCDE